MGGPDGVAPSNHEDPESRDILTEQMASALFLIDLKGQPIVCRDYRGEVKMSDVPTKFADLVINADSNDVKPILTDDGITYCWTKQNDIYILIASRQNVNAAMLTAFLHSMCELFTAFFHTFEEESIRDRFVTTYELFDEIIDNGWPQLTELKVLKKVITSAGSSQKNAQTARTPSSLTTAVSWRAEGIKHKKNEIFLDVIERLDCLVSANNKVLASEILGALKMKSYLSGMPELRLGLNDRLMLQTSDRAPDAERRIQTVDLQDVRFHHCVRLNKFEAERVISFVPPDGAFELMTYRLPNLLGTNQHEDTQLPFWVEATLSPQSLDPNGSRVDYIIKIKSTYKPKTVASAVELQVPTPVNASNPTFKTSSGNVKYRPESSCFVWTLRHFQGQREQLLTASLARSTVGGSDKGDPWYKRPMELQFEIPFFTMSRINVRYLKIFETSGYHALPWVRYITQNGVYQIRLT